jgi:CRP/FNR family cyclic AMP-dependent transcriptional regulator
MDPVEVLLGTTIFRDLRRRDVEELLPDIRRSSYARGESVWLEGAPADALFVIVRGQLKSYRVSREGNEVILALHSGGEVAGEVGLFHPSGTRRVNVSAMEPTVCLILGRTPLVAFMTRHPPAMERMLERLSELTVRAAYSFSGVAFDDIRRRVAGALLALGDEFGTSSGDGVRIRLKVSQSTLAALVAASRENVNRALSGYVTSGVVSQRDGYFVIHDRAALEAGSMGRR